MVRRLRKAGMAKGRGLNNRCVARVERSCLDPANGIAGTYLKEANIEGRLWKMVGIDGRDPWYTAESGEILVIPMPTGGGPGDWLPFRSERSKPMYPVSFSPYEWLVPGGRLFEVEAVLEDGRMPVGALESPYEDDAAFPTSPVLTGAGGVETMRLVRERPDLIPSRWRDCWELVVHASDVRLPTRFSRAELTAMTRSLLLIQKQARDTRCAKLIDLSMVHLLRGVMETDPEFVANPLAQPVLQIIRLLAGLLVMEDMTFAEDGALRHAELFGSVQREWERMSGMRSLSIAYPWPDRSA